MKGFVKETLPDRQKKVNHGKKFLDLYNRKCASWGCDQVDYNNDDEDILFKISLFVKKAMLDSLPPRKQAPLSLPPALEQFLVHRTITSDLHNRTKTVRAFCSMVSQLVVYFNSKHEVTSKQQSSLGPDCTRSAPGPSGSATLLAR